MKGLLEGRVALVTGSGRGIGRAIAVAFAEQGATVALHGRDLARLESARDEIGQAGGEAFIVAGDLTDDVACRRVVTEAIERGGRIDVLVNNAGISRELPFVEMPLAVWDEIIAVNLRSVMVCTQEVVRHMIERGGGGTIVTIASASAIRGLPGSTAYSAAKAGVVGFCQALGDELRPHGIRVNSLCPGPVDTELFRQSERRDFILAAGGDVFDPATIASGALFLASELSSGMSSQVLTMRGFNRW